MLPKLSISLVYVLIHKMVFGDCVDGEFAQMVRERREISILQACDCSVFEII
jgi:hypothetical protein